MTLSIKDSVIFNAYLTSELKVDRSKTMKAAHKVAKAWKNGEFASVIGSGSSCRRSKELSYSQLLGMALKMIYKAIRNPFDIGAVKFYSSRSRRLQRTRLTD